MGPLDGVQVVEIASLAPAPFGCMVLADLGADVLRVDRADTGGPDPGRAQGPLSRGRRSVQLNLKDPEGIGLLLALLEDADVLVEGFRPGVAERLGFGPEECAAAQPAADLRADDRLGPGRPAGAHRRARHRLHRDLRRAAPARPGGRAADPAGQPAGRLRRRRHADGPGHPGRAGGTGAVRARPGGGRGHGGRLRAAVHVPVRAAGQRRLAGRAGHEPAGHRGAVLRHVPNQGRQVRGRGRAGGEVLRGAAGRAGPRPAADGEPPLPHQLDESGWPVLREKFTAAFASRTRDEWEQVFAGTDACVSPVLSAAEAPSHPHNAARGTFTEVAAWSSPAPRRGSAAPRRARPARRRSRARTPPRCWPGSATRPRRSARCARAAS